MMYFRCLAFLILLISAQSFVPVERYARPSSTFLMLHENRVGVALTREDGKNGKLLKELANQFGSTIQMQELPCIAHADGPDFDRLASSLEEKWDYVIVTSPEAARVLASKWKADGSSTKVVAVGKATEDTLRDLAIQVAFVPSKATAKVLVQELPVQDGFRVLYPASAQAKTTLEEGLKERGVDVIRLNTYDTVTATWVTDEKRAAETCRIACFASPSSVEGWLTNTCGDNKILAACIGETSAEACRQKGWEEDTIFYPEKPGIQGWVEAVGSALERVKVEHV